ncbi:probable asparagine--tRNA ligase, mitochondrial [Contarinia nasturtii]|uniref:probable asparagine--tRNA ligase, mitochondrial n=1 Tax=Contarinia nasturtii TaxID=265458 RepID=UPI0012D49376|nr:probable asparagine--tRNA ligase, mitochondrial [Contarinia nasturtii]
MFLKNIVHLNLRTQSIGIRLKSTYLKIKDVNNSHVGNTIQIKGWVNNFRKQKKMIFLDLKDGSTNEHLQVMVDRETYHQNPGLGYGAGVVISGIVGTAPRGHLELRAETLQLNGTCPTEDGIYPFVRKQTHSPDYIRDHLHFRGHTNQFQSIFRARHLATHAFHRYFVENGFCYIHTPILTTNTCEGACELFTVRPLNEELLESMQSKTTPKLKDDIYFNQKTFLTISGQMHLEAMCFRLGSVYNFGPIFRAENSRGPIHMSEFYMIEAEESFVESIEDVTNRIESTIKSVTKQLLDENAKEIHDAHNAYRASLEDQTESQSLEERLNWIEKPFETITYAEAAEILQKHYNSSANDGLSKSDELTLVKHFGKPVFVVNWPRELKAFYMRRCKHDQQLVEAIDLLMPHVGELAGGSVREDNYDILKSSMPDDLQWYLDLRKYGGCTTGGFGIGFDRYLQVLLGVSNIKDTIPFPRWPHNCRM